MPSFLVLACVLAAADTRAPLVIKDFVLADAKGKKHTRVDWKDKKAVVLFFLGTDCPVSNFYCPEYLYCIRSCALLNSSWRQAFALHPVV